MFDLPNLVIMQKMPFHVMTKPIGPICNLDCTYCFYLKKEALFPQHARAAEFRMSDATLESYIRQYAASQPGPEISFAWQGGEPTLLGLDYFEKIVALQKQLCPPGKRITNAIQTNGTLLTDAWCTFLARERFLVGLSIDGPAELHNRYRVTRGSKATFDQVYHGLTLLKKHNVDFNTLTVVNKEVAENPLQVYEFLREHGSGYIQFIPLVERLGGGDNTNQYGGRLRILSAMPEVAPWSVEPLQYGKFLSDIFDVWIKRDVGRIFVQIFDVQLGIWAGYGATLCVFAETCGSALALEHTGDLYACDHFVSPEYKLGNINTQRLDKMANSPEQKKFGTDKRDLLPQYCRSCEVRFACQGECPKNRFAFTPDGEPGLNYLCAGYKHFLNHVRPQMLMMAELIRHGRPAADVMSMPQPGRHPPSPAAATAQHSPQ